MIDDIDFRRDALGIGGYNVSNAILQFQGNLQGYLRFGFEQSIDMDILEQTRLGRSMSMDWRAMHYTLSIGS